MFNTGKAVGIQFGCGKDQKGILQNKAISVSAIHKYLKKATVNLQTTRT